MQISLKDLSQWHPVPFAWIPFTHEGTLYWLESPPLERRAVPSAYDWEWEHRLKTTNAHRRRE